MSFNLSNYLTIRRINSFIKGGFLALDSSDIIKINFKRCLSIFLLLLLHLFLFLFLLFTLPSEANEVISGFQSVKQLCNPS